MNHGVHVSLSSLFYATGEVVPDPSASTSTNSSASATSESPTPPTVQPSSEVKVTVANSPKISKPLWPRALGVMLMITGLIGVAQQLFLFLIPILERSQMRLVDTVPYELLEVFGFFNLTSFWSEDGFQYLVLPIQLGIFIAAGIQLIQAVGLFRNRKWVYRWLQYGLILSLFLHVSDIVVQLELVNPLLGEWGRRSYFMDTIFMNLFSEAFGFSSWQYGSPQIAPKWLEYLVGTMLQCWPQLILLLMLCKSSVRKTIRSWA